MCWDGTGPSGTTWFPLCRILRMAGHRRRRWLARIGGLRWADVGLNGGTGGRLAMYRPDRGAGGRSLPGTTHPSGDVRRCLEGRGPSERQRSRPRLCCSSRWTWLRRTPGSRGVVERCGRGKDLTSRHSLAKLQVHDSPSRGKRRRRTWLHHASEGMVYRGIVCAPAGQRAGRSRNGWGRRPRRTEQHQGCQKHD